MTETSPCRLSDRFAKHQRCFRSTHSALHMRELLSVASLRLRICWYNRPNSWHWHARLSSVVDITCASEERFGLAQGPRFDPGLRLFLLIFLTLLVFSFHFLSDTPKLRWQTAIVRSSSFRLGF